MIRSFAVPFCLLAMAGCADVRDQAWPDRTVTIERDKTTYRVDAKYEPLGLTWVARVWSPQRRLTAADRALMIDLVSRDAGRTLCEGGVLEIDDGGPLNPLAGDGVMFFETIGEWRLVGSCS